MKNGETILQQGKFAYDRKDWKVALTFFLQVANDENEDTTLRIEGFRLAGKLYEDAPEDKEDFYQAYECYKNAADLGNIQSMLDIARLYRQKDLGCFNSDECVEWYERAIQNGFIYAWVLMGDFYKENSNIEKAKKCYYKALDLGENHALMSLGYLYKDSHQYDDALKWFTLYSDYQREKGAPRIQSTLKTIKELKELLGKN